MVQEINPYASDDNIKIANKHLSKKLTEVHGAFAADISASTAVDLEKMMGIHVRLQTVPPPKFMALWVSQSAKHMDEYSPEWYRTSFENFSKLGVYPGDEWIKDWWAVAPKDLSGYQPSDLYRIAYRMAIFDFMRRDDESLAGIASPCRQIADEIMDYVEARADKLFPQSINNQVFFAGLWFGKDFVKEYQIADDGGHHSSAFERKIMDHMRQNSKVQVSSSGIVVPVTGHKIDLQLSSNHQIFGCEVDGISHFNRIVGETAAENAVIYNPSTRFHSWMIAEYLEINTLRIPYFKFDETEDGIPWEKTLNKIARKDGHSVYAWHGDSKLKDMRAEKNAHLFRGHDL